MKMYRFFLIVITLLFTVAANALEITRAKYEHFTVDEGLSQNNVEAIFQDSQGYIWIGTQNGLNKYNGLYFQTYLHESTDSNSLASSWVNAIAEDKNGLIWIGSDGLNYYNPLLDKMVRIVEDAENEQAFHGGKVYDITPDAENNLWIATSKGLVFYNQETELFKTFNSDENTKLQGANFYCVLLTQKNKIFVASDSDPIYEFDPQMQSFIAHNYKQDYFAANYKKNIAEDGQGNLYIGSEGGGVHVYNPGKKTSQLLDVGENGLATNNVKTQVLPISDSEVIIGTDGGGINLYNQQTGLFTYSMNDPKMATSLGSDAILSMCFDNDGNLWVGHYGAGLSIMKTHKFKFESFYHNPFIPESISNGVVTAIFQDSEGRIWIGLDGGGLSQFFPETGTFNTIKMIEGDPTSLSSNVIVSIAEDDSGNLLLGTYAGGLMVFNPITRQVERTYQPETGLSAAHIWDITLDVSGKYWISTLGGGYDILDWQNDTIINFRYGQEASACSDVILSINRGPQGNMWFATESAGICVITPQNGFLKRYTTNDEKENTISSNDVKCIVFDGDYAWVGTNGGGLNRIDLKTDSIDVLTTAHGLVSNSIMGILVDDSGVLWLSSTRGMMKYNPVSGVVTSFDKSQGLQGNEFRYNSQFKLQDGKMLFGGANGLTYFDPSEISISPVEPPVVFDRFLVYNQPVAIGAKGSPLNKHINYTDYLKINHKQRVFTLEFASLDYTSPNKNQFKYFLEGIDEDWTMVGNRNFVTYTNLPAGKYTFRLKSSNSDGVWNNDERQITIRIRPPWYKTKAFIILAVLTIIFAIYTFIKRREKQAKIEKEMLQKKIDEGQAIIDEKLIEVKNQQQEIKRKEELEKEIRFQTDGLAKFSVLIAKNRKDVTQLANAVISELTTYIGANAGALYIANKYDDGEVILNRTGHFCYDGENASKEHVLPGEGLVGSSYNHKKSIFNDNLPEGFIVVNSGLGSVSAKYGIIEPIVDEEEAMGVFEIASLETIPEYKIEFVRKVAQNFASVLAIEQANESSKLLLEENKQKTEEIMAHEEEMRQNMEEMQATQEMMKRQEEDLTKDLKKKEQLIADMKEKLKSLG
ncbi:MAG TPA: hypothetical protein DDX98_03405 [Bacteroidales bacterium]|nr:hypothetical protein [Bacteroidales bacterium]